MHSFHLKLKIVVHDVCSTRHEAISIISSAATFTLGTILGRRPVELHLLWAAYLSSFMVLTLKYSNLQFITIEFVPIVQIETEGKNEGEIYSCMYFYAYTYVCSCDSWPEKTYFHPVGGVTWLNVTYSTRPAHWIKFGSERFLQYGFCTGLLVRCVLMHMWWPQLSTICNEVCHEARNMFPTAFGPPVDTH